MRGGRLQQGRHRRALVGEQPDVAFRLGELEGAAQRTRGRRGRSPRGPAGERLEDEDLDDRVPALPALGVVEQAIEEGQGLAQ